MNLKGMTLVDPHFGRFRFRGHVAAVFQADGNQRFPIKSHSGFYDSGSRLAKRMARNEPKTCHKVGPQIDRTATESALILSLEIPSRKAAALM
jgi:hypothetical protein